MQDKTSRQSPARLQTRPHTRTSGLCSLTIACENNQTEVIGGGEAGHPMRYGDPPDDPPSCLFSPNPHDVLQGDYLLVRACHVS